MEQSTRRWLMIVAVAAIVVAGVGWLATKRAPQSHEPMKVTLTLKWLFDPGFAGEMVAEKQGYFHREGLDVSLQPGGFEVDPIRLVASGASQFGVAGADTFLIARSRGIPVVAIAMGYIQTPVAYYVRSDSNIRTVKDFAGKTVGVQAGQDTETILYAMLGVSGVARDAIKTYPSKYDISPFLTGTVDVWPGYIATQSYTLRQQGFAFRTIRPRDAHLNIPGTVYFTTERFLSDHPDVVANFVKAIRSGWEYTYAHPNEAADIVSSFDSKALPKPLVLSNFGDQRDQIIPQGYSFGEVRLADWERLKTILEEQHLLVGPVDLSQALKPVK